MLSTLCAGLLVFPAAVPIDLRLAKATENGISVRPSKVIPCPFKRLKSGTHRGKQHGVDSKPRREGYRTRELVTVLADFRISQHEDFIRKAVALSAVSGARKPA